MSESSTWPSRPKQASDDDVVLDKSGETHVGENPGVRSSQ
jgi:hypothetical protein